MTEWKDILLLGDSIAQGYWDHTMQGWFGRMMHRIGDNYPYQFGAHNCAMSGDKAVNVWHRLCGEALSREPEYLIVSVGLNDLWRVGAANADKAYSMAESFVHWEKILAVAKNNFDGLLVTGLTFVETERMPDQFGDYLIESDIVAYNSELRNFCQTNDIAFCELYSLFQENGECLHDGLHPNAKGHQLIADHVYQKLEELKWLN